MKVLYFAAYYTRHYVRQDVVRKALKKIEGLDVIECVYNSRGPLRYPMALWKFILIPKKGIDAIIVGFRGHELLPIIRLLTRKPVIFDAFISLFDTLCFDRKKFSPRSLLGRLTFWLDRHDCNVASHILLDTDAHIRYFGETFHINREKFSRVFVGADDRLFYPTEHRPTKGRFEVFYYGTALPVHGIDVVLHAAKLLENESEIIFKLVGPIRSRYQPLIERLQLQRVELVPWVPYDHLPHAIGQADLCLAGHFSDTGKARRVIPGKAFQFAAMSKPIILGDNPGNREVFTPDKDCLMVEMNNPGSLAQGIIKMYRDQTFRDSISKHARQTYEGVQQTIVQQLKKAIYTFAS